MDGFGKLQNIRNGQDVVTPDAEAGFEAIKFMPHAAEKSFDNLPLHIQAWALNGKKPRCSGGERT